MFSNTPTVFGQPQQSLSLFGGQQTSPFGQTSLHQVEPMDTTPSPPTPQVPCTQIQPFNWSGLPQGQGGQQQVTVTQPQPFFNPTQSFLQQTPPQFAILQPQQQNLAFNAQPQAQQLFNAFGQPVNVNQTTTFGQQQQQPFFMQQCQPQQLEFVGFPQPQPQPLQQYQAPYVLQPIFIQESQKPSSSMMSFSGGGGESLCFNTVPPTGESNVSISEKFLRSSLLHGRGPSILTPDPAFQSPLFDWGRHPQSGEPCATGFNPELLSTLMKSPGEEVAARGRRTKSMERLELDTLRAQVKLLSENVGRFTSGLSGNSRIQECNVPPPPPVGLFDQDLNLRDEWSLWQERHKRRDNPQISGFQRDRLGRNSGPPKYNDGIDPITGKSLLEKYTQPYDRKWNMRALAGGYHGGNEGTIDTIFDLPSSSSTSCSGTPDMHQFSHSHHKQLFHNHRFIGNSPSTSTSTSTLPPKPSSPMKFCPNGLIRLDPGVVQDLAPRYRSPVRIGGGGSASSSSTVIKKPGWKCKVTLSKANYYCRPDLDTLDFIADTYSGKTIVSEFVVGHSEHGKVMFPGDIDVAGLDLDQIVEFSNKQVLIYPDGVNKPAYGQELNRRAVVTLENIWPKCKETGLNIRDVGKIGELNYERILQKSCARFHGKFLSYDPRSGVWVFEIQLEPFN